MPADQTRYCFVEPIPQLAIAADLLSHGADALLAGDRGRACAMINEANIPAVHAHATRIMSGSDKSIYQYRVVDGAPPRLALAHRSKDRTPSPAVAANVLSRDGYRCRFCGCRVVSARARSVLAAALPELELWPRKDADRHAAFLALSAVVDHLVPHARGGTSAVENLVTACQACNYGRMALVIEEVGISDPRLRSPVVDSWDGLTRLLGRKLNQNCTPQGVADSHAGSQKQIRAAMPAAISVDHPWLSASRCLNGGLAAALLEMLHSLSDIGVSLHLNKILLVRLQVGSEVIDIFGIEQSGEIEVPWLIGKHKDAFRPFAVALAAALPDGEAYVTPKMWRVRKAGGRMTVQDLVGIAGVFRAAVKDLAVRLSKPGT